jgi:membrane protein implicated in regulation of membrane protease activity
MENAPPQLPPASVENAQPASKSGWTLRRATFAAGGAVISLILLIFIIGVGLALFSNVEVTAPRVQIIRDIFLIILALQGILVVIALAVLILQIARLISLLQNEIKPILENTQETLSTARGTVEFVGKNLAEPVVRVNGFMAALTVLFRELFGIRRALRRREDAHEPTNE